MAKIIDDLQGDLDHLLPVCIYPRNINFKGVGDDLTCKLKSSVSLSQELLLFLLLILVIMYFLVFNPI